MAGVIVEKVQMVGSNDLEHGYGFNLETNNHKRITIAFRTRTEAEKAAKAAQKAFINAIWSYAP